MPLIASLKTEELHDPYCIPLTGLLPYAIPDEEPIQLLNNIKSGISVHLGIGDWIGAFSYISRLENYIELKYPLTVHDRVELCRLFYTVLTDPDTDYHRASRYAYLCIKLVQHEYHVPSDALTLPWRPLYNKLKTILQPKYSSVATPDMGENAHSIKRLPLVVSRFFGSEATSEILALWLPTIQPYSPNAMLTGISWLRRFLPVEPTTDGCPPTWLPTLFQCWMEVARSAKVCEASLSILGRLAKQHANYRSDTPMKQPLFETYLLEWAYDLMLHYCSVPLANGSHLQAKRSLYKPAASHALVVKQFTEKWFATFVIWTIRTDETDEHGMPLGIIRFEKWLQAFESFFHPSNAGRRQVSFAKYIKQAAKELLTRVRMENDDRRFYIRPENRLTKPMLHRLVCAFRPVLLLSMFSKTEHTVYCITTATSYLACIDPDAIVPSILERAIPALESLTEVHRTISVIRCLSTTASTFFHPAHYTKGMKYLGTLFNLILPGLDPNDETKCTDAASFISTVLSVTSLDAISKSTRSSFEESSTDIEVGNESNYLPIIPFDVEEWTADYFTRLLVTLDGLSDGTEHTTRGYRSKQFTSAEKWPVHAMLHSARTIFSQLSVDSYKSIIHNRLIQYIRDYSSPTLSYGLAELCQVAAAVQPTISLGPLIDLCVEQIREELEYGAGARHRSEHSDLRLHWYQLILAYVIGDAGAQILEHTATIMDILHLMQAQCHSKRSIELYGNVLGKLLFNLTTCHTSSAISDIANDVTNTAEQQDALVYLSNIKVKWHIPNEMEITFAMKVLKEFMTPMLTRLEWIAGQLGQNVNEDRALVDEAERLLMLIHECSNNTKELVIDHQWTSSVSSSNMNEIAITSSIDGNDDIAIPTDKSVDLQETELLNQYKNPRRFIEAGYAVKDRDSLPYQEYNRIHRQLLTILHRIGQSLQQHRDNAVNCLKLVLLNIKVVVIDRGFIMSDYRHAVLHYYVFKMTFEKPLDKKQWPYALLRERATCSHLRRLRYNLRQMELLPEHLSDYAEVRREAQDVLDVVWSAFPSMKRHGILQFVNILTDPEASSTKLKGAYYSLSSERLSMRLANMVQMKKLATALVLIQREAKPSIMALASEFFNNMCRFLPAYHQFLMDNPTLREEQIAEKVANRRFENSVIHRKEIESSFTDLFINDNLQGTFQLLALRILYSLQHNGTLPSTRLAEMTTKYMFSETPVIRLCFSILLMRMLGLMKRQTWKTRPHPLKHTMTLPRPMPDNFTATYVQNSLDVETVAEWPLLDKNYIGTRVWPDKMITYQFGTEPLYPTSMPPDVQEIYMTLSVPLSQSSFWSRLLDYTAKEHETGSAGRTLEQACAAYKLIAEIFGVKAMQAQLQPLRVFIEAYDESHKQQAAAEMLSGIIRGSKHWPQADRDYMWQETLPLLQLALDHATPETLQCWEFCVYYIIVNRDPRRILPLLGWFEQNDLQLDPASLSAFDQVKLVLLWRNAIEYGSWKLRIRLEPKLQGLLSYINFPYQKVRDEIGMQLHIPEAFASVTTRLAHDQQTTSLEVQMTTVDTSVPIWMTELLEQLAGWREQYIHTITHWMQLGMKRYGYATILPYTLVLLPELLKMQELRDKEELYMQTTRLLYLIADYPYPPQWTPKIAHQLLDLLKHSTSWRIRNRILLLLQVFYFKQLFNLDASLSTSIIEQVTAILQDPQLENECLLLLKAKPPPRKVAKTDATDSAATNTVLHQRHAGALGLSSMILAFPYEIPSWMPSVMIHLSKCLADPEPIKSTVRHTFAEFKRTHQDTWREDSRHFSEEQLEELTDLLVSPSYYA
ncbi:hypothetical protein BDF22DRAFT_703922 [Syncephalis plumigaleata]|nr:hypothetical protein BDF22DRAFT_703922 [Syncephalis plumigaleata]